MNLIAILTWLLMRISWIDCSLSEVQKKQYQSNCELVLVSGKINICDKKIEFLNEKSKEVKDRRDCVDTKARTLLTLTSLLLGLMSSTASIASAKIIGFWSILPLLLLFATIFLLTVYFGVNRSQTTDYSYVFSSDIEATSVRRELCNDLIKSQDCNNRVTDFMVDLYRSALRYFSLAMLFIMFFGVKNIIFK